MCRAQDWEERAAHRVSVALPVTDRTERSAEPLVVMREDLIDASRKIVERIAVCRKHARDWQGSYCAQRVEKVAEGIVARIRVEPDVRGDAWRHVIAGEEHALGSLHEHGLL
jgi:hypothetical protein